MLKKSLILLLLFFLSCTESSTEVAEEANAFLLPLAVGNQWSYEVYWTGNPDKIVYTVYQTVMDTMTIGGILYYIINNENGRYGPWVASNQKDGLLLSSSLPDSTSYFNPSFFKFPAEDGEIYTFRIPNTDSTFVFEVQKSKLQINENSYDCYGYYNHNVHSLFPFIYFVPDIGMIRHVGIYYTDMMRSDTSNLIIWDNIAYMLVE